MSSTLQQFSHHAICVIVALVRFNYCCVSMQLLDTIDVSPEEMAAFFEKPSYEPAAAGGKTLPGAAASMLDSDAK
jgi:hypothetical protein